MSDSLNAAALDQLFRTARTQNAFADTPVSHEVLRELYELVKWGPPRPIAVRRALCS